MNFDDDALSAPVWDELNADFSNKGTADSTVNELSQTFAQIDTRDDVKQSSDTEEHQEESEEAQEKGTQEQERIHEQKLLDRLAPEEGLGGGGASDFGSLEKETAELGKPEGFNDPLFSGSMLLSPINVTDNVSDENRESNISPRKKSGNRPQKLFDGVRLRRREKPVPSLGDNDPLGKAQKENQFVDEPLNETATNSPITTSKKNSHDRKNIDILKQMEEPLFPISPKKEINYEDEGISPTVPATKDSEEGANERREVEQAETSPVEPTNFNIEVKDPIKVGELTSAHIEYSVQTESPSVESGFSLVTRRYRDFRWLYRQLQSNHWGKIIPPPPEKQTVGRFKRDFIENRRFQMENMLRKISRDPILQKDNDFIFFLTSDNFASDSKIRTHISGSGAYNDNNDISEIHISEIKLLGVEDANVVLKNGGIDADNNKGFMNLSFSSTPKYNETDPFFIEERERLDFLEEQLKQLYKSLELIDTERFELSLTIEEFANMIKALADLEVTKESSELLINFAAAHDQIKLALERNSLQESLTMGTVLDEYIRSLASVKATFNQRYKLGYFLGIIDSDLKKKQAQYNKIKGNDSEKTRDLKTECQTLQTRHNKISKWWQDIALIIKKEVSMFESDKIEEFRNSIEISLEAAIESQKECIEVWETFYQNNL